MNNQKYRRFGEFLKGCASVFDLYGVLSAEKYTPEKYTPASEILKKRIDPRSSVHHEWIQMKPKPVSDDEKTPDVTSPDKGNN